MAKIIIDGLTKEQAKELTDWFEGHGSEDYWEWFNQIDEDIPTPYIKNVKTKGDDIIIKMGKNDKKRI